ncbi:hypothetical protein [Sphingomonas sp. CARO-RG-8B-R24-01]|uniref:hypothetical protein n=1 Tax=Sphingomonas sp. CARO-RG-8B-R24-01 TaxID=2914831 RepID=UPI001F57BC79|nr:hypothetical protein [Sphingomonas sp. CARO-RG-8B-R24-01]
MSKLGTWFAANAARIVFAIGVVALITTVISIRSCRAAQTVKTEARLEAGQASAAVASGADAVNTVGNRAQEEEQTDAISRENDATIRNAEGAATVVPAGVSGAGISALCRRAAYAGDPRCAQPR